MAEVTEASADPSMEEILASIRKIISDEKPPEQPVVETEVLELTQMVQDDGSVVDLTAPEPEVAMDPLPSQHTLPPVSAPLTSSETLVSDPVAQTAASSLSSLANTVEIERLSSTPSGSSYIGNGSRTLEDMVIELMRPLLKDWLDKNLPGVVERLVQKEIERIARRT